MANVLKENSDAIPRAVLRIELGSDETAGTLLKAGDYMLTVLLQGSAGE